MQWRKELKERAYLLRTGKEQEEWESMAAPLITGSWIDVVHPNAREGVYWNRKTLAYTDADWLTLVRHLHRDLGIELLLLQILGKEGKMIYPSKLLPTRWQTVSPDPVAAILAACAAEGVQLCLGLGYVPGGFRSEPRKAADWCRRLAEEVLERYGTRASFAGWYLSDELSVTDSVFNPEELAFARGLARTLRQLTPSLPIIASPYFRGGLTKSDALARDVAGSGVTVMAYQDGIGCTVKEPANPLRNQASFEVWKWVHDRTEVKLWANIELFRWENGLPAEPLLPGPFPRIRAQIKAAAPFVERVVAYTVPGLMTSQTICPDLGAPETERLYWAYRGHREQVLAARGNGTRE